MVLLAWEAVAQQLQGEGGTSEGYTSVRWQIRRGQHLRSRNTTHLALLPIRESLILHHHLAAMGLAASYERERAHHADVHCTHMGIRVHVTHH